MAERGARHLFVHFFVGLLVIMRGGVLFYTAPAYIKKKGGGAPCPRELHPWPEAASALDGAWVGRANFFVGVSARPSLWTTTPTTSKPNRRAICRPTSRLSLRRSIRFGVRGD